MTEVVPLLLWHEEGLTAEDVERIKAAKRALDLPFMVQLSRATPESDGNVIAIGTVPNFPCDFYFVGTTLDPDLTKAVAWAIADGPADMWVTTITTMLEDALGGPVREITDASDTSRPAVANKFEREHLDNHMGVRGPQDERAGAEGLPEHDPNCDLYGTTTGCGPRGCTDPNRTDERDYRRAIRAVPEDAEGTR